MGRQMLSRQTRSIVNTARLRLQPNLTENMIHEITRSEITRSNTNNSSCQFVSWIDLFTQKFCSRKQEAVGLFTEAGRIGRNGHYSRAVARLLFPSFWCRLLRLNLRRLLTQHNSNRVGLAVVQEMDFLVALQCALQLDSGYATAERMGIFDLNVIGGSSAAISYLVLPPPPWYTRIDF